MLIEKVAHWFSDAYAKHHSAFGIAAGCFGFAVFALAIYLHSQSEPYSFFTHFVSSLGWGPNGAATVFSVGLVMLGILMSPYVLFLFARIRSNSLVENETRTHWLSVMGLLCFVAALAGLILLSVFSDVYQPSFFWHVVGAPVYFMMSIAGIILFTWAMHINRYVSKEQIGVTLLVVFMFFGFLAAAGSIDTSAFGEGIGERILDTHLMRDMSAEERVGLVEKGIALAPWLGFFEWMVVLSTLLWFIIVGRHTYRNG